MICIFVIFGVDGASSDLENVLLLKLRYGCRASAVEWHFHRFPIVLVSPIEFYGSYTGYHEDFALDHVLDFSLSFDMGCNIDKVRMTVYLNHNMN